MRLQGRLIVRNYVAGLARIEEKVAVLLAGLGGIWGPSRYEMSLRGAKVVLWNLNVDLVPSRDSRTRATRT
jgi:hypothetical protein